MPDSLITASRMKIYFALYRIQIRKTTKRLMKRSINPSLFNTSRGLAAAGRNDQSQKFNRAESGKFSRRVIAIKIRIPGRQVHKQRRQRPRREPYIQGLINFPRLAHSLFLFIAGITRRATVMHFPLTRPDDGPSLQLS